MQLKSLTVAKKVWLLLGVVVGMLMLTSTLVLRYVSAMEAQLRAEMQAFEQRTRNVVRLRSDIEVSASTVVAAALAHDAVTRKTFESHYNEVQQSNTQLMQTLQAQLRSPQVRAVLDKVTQEVKQAHLLVQQLEQERRMGGDVGAFVRLQLTPTIGKVLALLDDMVRLQEQQLQQALDAGDQHRQQVWMVVVATMLVVLVVAVLLSRWLVRQMTGPLVQAVDLANAIAQGDLTRNVSSQSSDELGDLLRALHTMTSKLRALVGEVREGALSVNAAAAQIEEGNVHISSRTEQTAANLEQTAASLEELTATVSQSADTARQANQLAATAVQAAEQGGEVVNEVVVSMDRINASSRKIYDIIGVIDGIAFQTNILALNAAVEAARAGEQGRGFAVVAGEVRALAQRSADAAKEIKQLITDSVANVDAGAAQVAQAGERMQAIVGSVRRVTDLIADISAAAQQQHDGIAQVNVAVSELDQMTQHNVALVEESSAAALSMTSQAQRLRAQISVFRT